MLFLIDPEERARPELQLYGLCWLHVVHDAARMGSANYSLKKKCQTNKYAVLPADTGAEYSGSRITRKGIMLAVLSHNRMMPLSVLPSLITL
jgi:hypothetical protein